MCIMKMSSVVIAYLSYLTSYLLAPHEQRTEKKKRKKGSYPGCLDRVLLLHITLRYETEMSITMSVHATESPGFAFRKSSEKPHLHPSSVTTADTCQRNHWIVVKTAPRQEGHVIFTCWMFCEQVFITVSLLFDIPRSIFQEHSSHCAMSLIVYGRVF